jgi:hypothetical protein
MQPFLFNGHPFKTLLQRLREDLASTDGTTRSASFQEYFDDIFAFSNLVPRPNFDAVSGNSSGTDRDPHHSRTRWWWNMIFEPPLDPEKSRVLWTCRCGKAMYDDYKENVPGVARALEEYLRRLFTNHPMLANDSARHRQGPQRRGLRDLLFASKNAIGLGQRADHDSLPLAAPQTQPDSSSTNRRQTRDALFLLLCANSKRRRTPSLVQLTGNDIQTDSKFFKVLRNAYEEANCRNMFESAISLRKVQQINFVRFDLFPNAFVNISGVPIYPTPDRCNEYSPCRDFLTDPPIGSNLLLHFFENPHEAFEIPLLYNTVPKKLKTKLQICQIQKTASGWGLHLVEGLNWTKMWTLGLIGLFVSSVFGICWSIARQHNVQEGFAITACLMIFITFSAGAIRGAMGDP